LNDESYIKLALELAKKGKGKVSPNPLVGCVIVKDNTILSAGYHEFYGGPHAEANAINNAKCDLAGSTLYVNLEPCAHYGKTPPCVDKIIENKISRVVIGTLDPNPLVSGKGVEKLKEAGIDVEIGLCRDECLYTNRFFFKYITQKIPYITLKIAQTLDGKIADINNDAFWISSSPSRRFVHKLRSEYDAVLVGSNTIEVDNPQLTVRLTEGRNPKRIIVDTKLKIDLNKAIFDKNSDNIIIIYSKKVNKLQKAKIKSLMEKGVTLIPVNETKDGLLNIKAALKDLGTLNISSILVEGGQKIFTYFLKNRFYDDIITFISPKILGIGISSFGDLNIKNIRKSIVHKISHYEKIGDDIMVVLKR
jgi:diaminohydroxyphosphoribosylaminopyrimidine deaminase/5-amino-6-(5-phosphoribosylamino)uracil reductase